MSSPVANRLLLTVRETADRLRLSERTVRRMVASGVLPALRIGGSIRVDQAELDAWLYDEGDTAA